MARRSTAVEPDGTQTITSGRAKLEAVVHLADEILDHLFGDLEVGDHAIAQEAVWPRYNWGVRPTISLASSPTASTRDLPLRLSIATTEGSSSAMPCALT